MEEKTPEREESLISRLPALIATSLRDSSPFFSRTGTRTLFLSHLPVLPSEICPILLFCLLETGMGLGTSAD
jgi:hypothetical protein